MPARRGDPAAVYAADPGPGGLNIQVLAEISANLGRSAKALEDAQKRQVQLWNAVRPIPGIPIPAITTTSGVADYPELLSPRVGYWWDVKTITAATFTAGTVNLYAGGGSTSSGLVDSNLRFVFSQSGTYTFGSGQLLVPPGQRLIFEAQTVTGNVSPSLTVIEIAAWALPAYLM